jgi:uncharacterized membrane protein YhaH (DUF805 family)
MATESPVESPSFRFLFRTDQGRIDRAVWWRGAAMVAIPLALMTGIWWAISGWAHRDLTERAFADPATFVAYAFLIVYAFAILLGAICFYNLSAKRFRDRGLPGAWAGLLPFAALVVGAAHWLQPRVAEVMPFWIVAGLDIVLVGVILWTLAELGFRNDATRLPG